MNTEYISQKSNLIYFENNPISLQNLPTEILEIILSNVPTNDSNHNLPGMRLVSKEINHAIIYSKNERIQKVFENILNNKFEKDIVEVKKIIRFCQGYNCFHRSLSIAYLQASRKIKTLRNKNFIKEISQEIYSTNLLNYSLWNNKEKKIVFICACRLGHMKIIKTFMKQRFVDPTEEDNEAIRIASCKGHKEVVELLLKDERIDPSALNNEAIQLASAHGHKEVVELLLQHKKVNPSAKNNIAIRWASWKGHIEIVELLLKDERVDPSARDNEAIIRASWEGHLEVVKLLLADKRVNPSAEDNFAIRHASEKGHKEVIELLLKDERVDPSANDNFAIRWASKRGYREVVELLLQDERVDPAAKDNEAIRRSSEDILTILFEWAQNNPNRKGSIEIISFILR